MRDENKTRLNTPSKEERVSENFERPFANSVKGLRENKKRDRS